MQAVEALVLSLPPIDEVVDGLDAHDLESEREGVAVPHEALKQLRPLLLAVGDLQKVCMALRAEYAASKRKPEVKFG
jgi:hypothetical protein